MSENIGFGCVSFGFGKFRFVSIMVRFVCYSFLFGSVLIQVSIRFGSGSIWVSSIPVRFHVLSIAVRFGFDSMRFEFDPGRFGSNSIGFRFGSSWFRFVPIGLNSNSARFRFVSIWLRLRLFWVLNRVVFIWFRVGLGPRAAKLNPTSVRCRFG